ncbi:MAG: anti-sigma F factor [Clostridia bacterium]|nr:anti-sigma F factor [Clostridia bacterium]
MNEMTVSFLSVSENEAFARTVIAAFIAPLDPTVTLLNEVKTAVSEAVTNAIVHGYENTQGMVTMHAILDGRKLTLSVSDVGCGIADIEQAMVPTYSSKPHEERSGIGFTVMQSFMDKLDVVSQPQKGTCVMMEKQL